MSLKTWATMRLEFLQLVGDSQVAREEAWGHLSEGYRSVATHKDVEVPELNAFDEAVTVTAGNDFVAVSSIDLRVFAILDGFNVTQGFEIYQEPGGMVGRNRFLDTTGKPPAGEITNYQRDGVRVYVRNTPSVDTVLRFRVRQQTPVLTAADANGSPLTPSEYDSAILFGAAESFYLYHPKTDMVDEHPVILSDKYRAARQIKIAEVKPTKAVEDKSRRETMRLRGYRLAPRSRRAY